MNVEIHILKKSKKSQQSHQISYLYQYIGCFEVFKGLYLSKRFKR